MTHENGDPDPELWQGAEQPVPLLTADTRDGLSANPSTNGDRPSRGTEAAGHTIRRSAADFSSERMLRSAADRPASGWRRAVFHVTGGLVRLGPNAAELRQRELVARVKTPILG